MEACLGLGRNQRSNNKSPKDLKLQQQQQQQQSGLHTFHHHHHQQQHQQQQGKLQQPVTNQNYYTTQQQPQQQRQHLITRGQQQQQQLQQQKLQQQQQPPTNVAGDLKQQQQQQPPTSPLLERQQIGQNVRQNVSMSATAGGGAGGAATPASSARTMPKYKNTAPTLPFEDLSPKNPISATQTMMSLQQSTIQVDVTPTLPSSVSPTNAGGGGGAANKSCRKISIRQPQAQAQTQHQHQHHHHHHHHHQVQQHQQQQLHLHQQQQMTADLDAIEICADPEPMVSFKGAGLVRHTKTLGRLHQTHSMDEQWSQMPQTTSMQLLQLQQHQQQQQQQHHDYSYAYYEPGAAMRHTNIPSSQLVADEEDLTPAPPNSIRALLSKGKKNKLLVSPATRQSYQVRLTQQHQKQFSNNPGSSAAAKSAVAAGSSLAGAVGGGAPSNISTPENFYEEISASSTSSSSNSMTSHRQLRSTSHSAGSLTQQLVEEELRRVQNRHHKILGELNLSVEAMLMPESPPNTSPTSGSSTNAPPKEPTAPTVSVTSASGQPLRLTSSSVDNICDPGATATVGGGAIAPLTSSATIAAGLLQTSCLGAADLDSGFSGSSGASYIGSLRLHKTNALMNSRTAGQQMQTSSAAAPTLATSNKSQQSAFAYATQSCRSFQRANTCIDTNASSRSHSSAIKHLPQVHGAGNKHPTLSHGYLPTDGAVAAAMMMTMNDDDDTALNSSGFFTRAACGRRILNCAKIRAAEDPGPVVVVESKARSFWNRKGWRKFPGFSTSTSSINDTGLATVKNILN
ncbi:myb-like protein I isoform X2 [Stomoxys calcitrans]|uniref:myb-like protein I isoform X2 n=1 Tax=Stomoxys calcitrans TaxID=35570 RepID=UPI0027E3976C|nr:myb-like protein I isoform X2 [Stomoxys calcitrans]